MKAVKALDLLEKKLNLDEEMFIPSSKVVVPYDIDLPGFDDGQINKGTEVKYSSYQLKEGYLLILYYNHLKMQTWLFEKVPLMFESPAEAIQLGWIVNQDIAKDNITDLIPSATQIVENSDEDIKKALNWGRAISRKQSSSLTTEEKEVRSIIRQIELASSGNTKSLSKKNTLKSKLVTKWKSMNVKKESIIVESNNSLGNIDFGTERLNNWANNIDSEKLFNWAKLCFYGRIPGNKTITGKVSDYYEEWDSEITSTKEYINEKNREKLFIEILPLYVDMYSKNSSIKEQMINGTGFDKKFILEQLQNDVFIRMFINEYYSVFWQAAVSDSKIKEKFILSLKKFIAFSLGYGTIASNKVIEKLDIDNYILKVLSLVG